MKKNSGITLIALAITMVIMLILAAISVATLSGDNSLIKNAGEAKEDADVKQEQDIINQAVYQAMNNNTWGELVASELQNELENITKREVTITPYNSKFKASFTDSGRSYIVDEKGQSKKTTVVKTGDTDLSTVSDLSTKYGVTVDYKSTSHPDIIWQLFLADEDNYYLISSDYVPTNELPCSGNTMNGVTYGSSDLQAVEGISDSYYKVRFASTSSYNDYVMTSTTEHRKGSQSNILKSGSSNRNPLVSTYLRWVDLYPNSSNINISAVAYMMDTSKWASFSDGADGAYAIGGPTIEMLSLSWNAISGHTQMTSYATMNDSNSNSNGYISQSPETESSFFGTTTNMWFVKETENAAGYWLSSPSSGTNAALRIVHYSGYVNHDGARDINMGIRPIVVVPK